MKLFLSIFILISFFSCTRTSKKNNQTADNGHTSTSEKQTVPMNNTDTTVIDPNTLGCLVTHNSYSEDQEQLAPGTFNKITYVYNAPKSGAKIIDTLSFNTSVNILKDYPKFYLVCTPKAKSGYIYKTDLYLNRMIGSDELYNTYDYLIGINKYTNYSNSENSTLKFVKIDGKSSKILNVYTDSIRSTYYGIKSVYDIALKNTIAIFHITYMRSEGGIETDADLFIIDNGKKISRLILEEGSGDDGYNSFSNIYLPVTLKNGKKVVLAKNGELTLDPATAKPEIFTYPTACGIPISELVVVKNWWEEAPEDGQPHYNADGTEFNKITIGSTILYKWDGNTLHKIKEIKGQQSPF